MKLEEIIYTIRDLRTGGNTSDDDGMSDDNWAFIVNNYRAKLIKEEQNNTARRLPDDLVQNLGVVDLVEVSDADCPREKACIQKPSRELPTPILTKGKRQWTFVGTPQGTPFHKTSFNEAYYIPYRKYTSQMPFWYPLDNSLRVINKPTPRFKKLRLMGVFEDPVAAAEFAQCPDGENCLGLSVEYPMPAHWVDNIIKMIASAELALLRNSIEDEKNNSRDDTTQPGPGPATPR